MMHTPTRSAFGAILGHPTKPHLRMFFPPPEGEGAGGGSGAGGAGGSSGGDGGQGGSGGGEGGSGGGNASETLSAEDAKAIRATADKAMRERNAARDEAKAYKDLGVTPEQIAQWKADAEKAAGGPTPEQIAQKATRDAEAAATAKFAAKARSSEIRTQAAALGFHNPQAALAMLDPKAVEEIAVGDDLEADGAAVKALLEKLATAEPYLVKPKDQQTADYRTAGIGGAGTGARPDPGPGTPRLAAAYAASSARK